MRYILLGAFAIGLVSGTNFIPCAAAGDSTQIPTAGAVLPSSVRAAEPDAIRQPVVELYTALEAMMKAGQKLPFQQRYNVLAAVIDQVFDLDYVLQASVGRSGSAVSETSRRNLVAAFRRFTVASYVANFDKDAGQRFEILPDPREAGANWIVQTRIVDPTGGRFRLDYVMRRTGPGWRVVDVLLDGTISRVAVQHSDFRVLLRQDNGGALVGSLQRKVAELSGGSLEP
jgi:phospholipid transport system substrate-binding protein